MAKMVGGFLIPHVPLITALPQAAPKPSAEEVHGAFKKVSDRLRDLEVDTVLIIGDDHYTNFGPHCIPRYLIGIGDVDGPIEPWLGVQSGVIANNEPLARHILECGFEDNIDWAFAKAITVDHAIAIPHHLVVRSLPKVRSIPIYLNAAVPPLLSNRRAFQIGQSISRAVESWGKDERVAILGTGGLSHWVGLPQMGQVNQAFDRQILDFVTAGKVEDMIALPDDKVLAEAGNGALEIKNWICAMGAVPGAKAQVISYEAVPAWVTGLGFVELKAA